MTLKDKTIFITGGSTGIGLETAKMLLEKGANVGIYSITPLKDKTLLKNSKILFIKGDITKENKVNDAIKRTIKRFGNIDVLINNAAIVQKKEFIKTEKKDWDKIIDVNIKGTLTVTKEFTKEILKLKKKKRMIVNISSGAGIYGVEHLSIYSLTKSAIINLSQTLDQEISKYGIKTITITPGSVNTGMFKKAFPKKDARHSPEYVSEIITKAIEGKIKPDKNLIVDRFKHER